MRAVEAHLEGTSALSAPTITPDTVQFALDTYSDHSELGTDTTGAYTECADCGDGPYAPHTIGLHALERANAALRAALAAGEQR